MGGGEDEPTQALPRQLSRKGELLARYPLSLLTAFAASSPKGAPLGYAGDFTATTKSRPLEGRLPPLQGKMSP